VESWICGVSQDAKSRKMIEKHLEEVLKDGLAKDFALGLMKGFESSPPTPITRPLKRYLV
jgi:hypothetical protein